jgi:hypothetical protein
MGFLADLADKLLLGGKLGEAFPGYPEAERP